MKILVTVKRVEDPAMKITLRADGSGINTEMMKYVINPFDEIAVEEALRLRDLHGGEVVVVSVGPQDATAQIRTALAMGADRAVHVVCEQPMEPQSSALILEKIARSEKPELFILGKQAIDDDMGQEGILLAELLGWGQATCASKEVSLESDDEKNKKTALHIENQRLHVAREVDGGIEHLSVALPAVVTTELRLNIPRYAALQGIMKAKRKEIKELPLSSFDVPASMWVKVLRMEAPAQRQAGVKVGDVGELLSKLRSEAKVL